MIPSELTKGSRVSLACLCTRSCRRLKCRPGPSGTNFFDAPNATHIHQTRKNFRPSQRPPARPRVLPFRHSTRPCPNERWLDGLCPMQSFAFCRLQSSQVFSLYRGARQARATMEEQVQASVVAPDELLPVETGSRPLAFDTPGHKPTSRDSQWRRSLLAHPDGVNGTGQEPSTAADVQMVTLHTGLVYSSVMMLHAHPTMSTKTVDQHPEGPERIAKAFQVLKENGCVKRMKRIQPREVLKDEVALIHDMGIWEGVYRSQCE